MSQNPVAWLQRSCSWQSARSQASPRAEVGKPQYGHFGRHLFHQALILLSMTLILASSAQAGPKKVLGRIALYTAAGVSTFEFAHQTNLCRSRVDLARCQGGYGEVGVRQVANGFLTGGMIALSEWGHHKKFKEWFLPVAAVTAYNGVTAIQQARIHETKCDTR